MRWLNRAPTRIVRRREARSPQSAIEDLVACRICGAYVAADAAGCGKGTTYLQVHQLTTVTGGSATVRDVITVKGSTGYQDDNEVRLPQQLTRSTILATRLGDCPANQQPPTARPTPPRR